MKPFLAAFDRSLPPPLHPPAWFMRQAGRYLPEYRATRAQAGDFLALCDTPALAAEVTLQPLHRYPLDAAILFADILLLPRALGQKLWFETGEGPRLDPLTPERFAALSDNPDVWHQRLAPVYETLDRLRPQLSDRQALIGFAGAPWTVATYMVEGGSSKRFAASKALIYREPERWAAIIDLLVESTVAYLSRQVEAGAEALQLFDSWAGALSAPEIERWSVKPLQRIAERLKAAHPQVPLILFPRGVGSHYSAYRQIGAGLSLDSGIDLHWALSELAPYCSTQGNLDPALLAVGGQALDREVDRILDITRGHHHIFNLGHGIWQETPPEHLTQVLTRVKA